MDSQKLKTVVTGRFESQAAFARELGWSDAKVCAMLNDRYIPDVDEAADIKEVLNLSKCEFEEIFLTKQSPNGDGAR